MFSFFVLFVNPCVLSLPRRVHLVEQVLVTLPEYLISPVVFSRVQLAQSSFCVVFCRSLFVLLSFFFWSLHCLSFFDLQLLITHLVSSNLRKLINFANTIICIQQVQYTSSDDIIFKLIIDTDCRFIHTQASSLHWVYENIVILNRLFTPIKPFECILCLVINWSLVIMKGFHNPSECLYMTWLYWG